MKIYVMVSHAHQVPKKYKKRLKAPVCRILSPLFQKVFTPGWLKVEPTFPEVKSKELQLPAFF